MSLSCDYHNFGSPFDYSDADLILRSKPSQLSGENHRGIATQFHVHKFILSKASPVFERLLSEIQYPDTDNQLGITVDEYANLPVLCLPEDSDTLHSLLTFIYPTDVAQPRTLESIIMRCATAKKYGMPSASAQFRAMTYGTRVAPVVTTKNAFRAYALAFNEGLTDEAFEAALVMLSLPQTIEAYSEDLHIASGPALYVLWKYRTKALKAIATGIQECVTEVGDLRDWLSSPHSSCQFWNPLPQDQFVLFTRNVIENFSNMSVPRFFEIMNSEGRFMCDSCGNDLQFDLLRLFSHLERRIHDRLGEVHRELLPLFEGSKESAAPQTLVQNFGAPFNRKDADLIIRSSDQVDFHVHKSILGMASVVFEDMFTVPGPFLLKQGQNNPVINLTEDSKTLHRLLTMLYPLAPSTPETLEDALSLFATCHKYQMDSTITRIHSLLKNHDPPLFTAQNSFHVYCVARRYDLKDEVLVAARLTLERPLNFDECGEDLQFISGADLMKLWRYRAECTKVANACILQLIWSDGMAQYGSSQRGQYNQQSNGCFSIRSYYDHFLQRVQDKPSPKLITDKQAFETAVRNQSYNLTEVTMIRIRDSVRALVEANLKAAIDQIDINVISDRNLVSSVVI